MLKTALRVFLLIISGSVFGGWAGFSAHGQQPTPTPYERKTETRMVVTPRAPDRPKQPVVTRPRGPNVRYSLFYAAPCSIITREEIEAILKRNDQDRAFVTPRPPTWNSDNTEAYCRYEVQYEHRIFPDEAYDNSLKLTVDFNNKYAKQGDLIVYPPPNNELIIINGLGDEALIQHDKTPREQDYGTAARPAFTDVENRDYLFVRKGELVLTFHLTSTVAGNTTNGNVIEIARKALARVP